MRLQSMLAVYFLFWVFSVFLVLPFGVRTAEEAGKPLVPGVNDALLGMQPGGRRRVLVRPERGWRVQTGACARGEEKGMTDLNELTKRVDAQDGNLVFKADIGAAIENENACQNKEALPQPRQCRP